jgi:hypothetical protein
MHLQHKGEDKDMVCDDFVVADDVSKLKGKWLDFVMHARWTGDRDGLFKLWLKIDDGDYRQRVDYSGATWWNDEDTGPYFKMAHTWAIPAGAARRSAPCIPTNISWATKIAASTKWPRALIVKTQAAIKAPRDSHLSHGEAFISPTPSATLPPPRPSAHPSRIRRAN